MNDKGRKSRKQAVVDNSIVNVLSQEELSKRIAAIESSMKASTWRALETYGKFSKKEGLHYLTGEPIPK